MRLVCPVCGERDRREFYYQGAALAQPEGEEWGPHWDDYLHNRDNPAGVTRDMWQHEQGCGAWLIVTRDTVSHTVLRCDLAVGARA
ncbi:sarcosine oxidase subunit delta [uncultured Roseovarius sp.]|uniref:sarcosine oxidase subunit delta n=1 Tax=uncultured Roseovarius sp. TaxID=293344 RepID=UPI002623F586|nr:sarcosine oxidase subunit delta [uncultured Roseovarius sp.]